MPRRPVQPPTPVGMCLRWLSVRDRTERELRTKLRGKGVEVGAIEVAIERIRQLGYLDDERFARARAESLLARGRLGPAGVAQRLSRAGVATGTAKEAIATAMTQRDEYELAVNALAKKHPTAGGSKDPKVRARAARFLLSRGFSSAVVWKAVRGQQ